MRISVPTIPPATQSPHTLSLSEAIEHVATFLKPGNVIVLTGAGVSVDSGIKAYRGKDGRYLNPNYKPLFYHQLVDETEIGFAFRQRYWLRSYLGYPSVRNALPNTTHFALAALQHTSFISKLITQNVDGLHQKALAQVCDAPRIKERILELHGSLHQVRCKYGHIVDRDSFQDWLSVANPQWKQYADALEKTASQPRKNPDGDVVLDGVSYDDFVIPNCPSCLLENRQNSMHKPQVTFFGEPIPTDVKERSFHDVELADRLFMAGTTLATYSAFRLVKRALELRKPVLLLNVGPARTDCLPGVQKIDMRSGSIIGPVVESVIGTGIEDHVVQKLLASRM